MRYPVLRSYVLAAVLVLPWSLPYRSRSSLHSSHSFGLMALRRVGAPRGAAAPPKARLAYAGCDFTAPHADAPRHGPDRRWHLSDGQLRFLSGGAAGAR